MTPRQAGAGRPKLLDLYCGAGGAGMGYYRAGFDVTGVDIVNQSRYPFAFHRADALEFLAEHWREYDVIHASPPCQAYSVTEPMKRAVRKIKRHPELIEPTRALLVATGKLYVIENVEGAPLINPLMLCGTMFGLRVLRHRLFEINPPIWFPPFACNHNGKMAPSKGQYHDLNGYDFITCAGNNFQVDAGRIAMDINWMTRKELSQAIPPAYTEYIGRQLLAILAAQG